jgi:hypothetical protein
VVLLRRFHGDWGYFALVVNALSGLYALWAWKVPARRGRLVWASVIFAEGALMLQVLTGTFLVSSKDYKAPGLHMFYGFVAFITVGLLYSYKYVWKAQGRMELAYGLGGLFLMGVCVRAILQVV